jgi:hypothetical protein
MPSYAQPFETGFGTAGGAAGGGFLGSLGRILEPLDYPRRALYGGANSILSALETGDVSQAVGALPAASGAILAGLLGGPVGLLAGSALGGLMFGAGEAVDPERFRSISLPEVSGTEDFLPNLALGLATDPLTFAGFGSGWRAAAPAGKAMGEGLEQAARWRGPMYPGGEEKLGAALAAGQGVDLATATPSLRDAYTKLAVEQNPHIANNPRLLGHIAPGSIQGRGGSEADVWFNNAIGNVTTFREANPMLERKLFGEAFTPSGVAPPPRPASDLMNPAVWTQAVGDIRVEHAPRMSPATALYERGFSEPFLTAKAIELEEQLAQQGLQGVDLVHLGQKVSEKPNYGNFGLTAGGDWKVIDPGSIHPLTTAGEPIARMGELAMREPRWYETPLLKLLGSDRAIQREIEDAVAATGRLPPITPQMIDQLEGVASSTFKPQVIAAQAGDEVVPALGASGIPDAMPAAGMSDEIVEAAGINSGSSILPPRPPPQRGMLEELASSLERPLEEPFTLPSRIDPRTAPSVIPLPPTLRRSPFAQTPWSIR